MQEPRRFGAGAFLVRLQRYVLMAESIDERKRQLNLGAQALQRGLEQIALGIEQLIAGRLATGGNRANAFGFGPGTLDHLAAAQRQRPRRNAAGWMAGLRQRQKLGSAKFRQLDGRRCRVAVLIRTADQGL